MNAPKFQKQRDHETELALKVSSLGSIAGFTMYGVRRNDLSHAVFNVWSIPREIQNGLNEYYILKWESKHLFRKLTNGMIEHKGKFFCVIFHGTTRAELEAKKYVLVSFRVPAPEYKLAPLALVSGQTTEE